MSVFEIVVRLLFVAVLGLLTVVILLAGAQATTDSWRRYRRGRP